MVHKNRGNKDEERTGIWKRGGKIKREKSIMENADEFYKRYI